MKRGRRVKLTNSEVQSFILSSKGKQSNTTYAFTKHLALQKRLRFVDMAGERVKKATYTCIPQNQDMTIYDQDTLVLPAF